MMPMRGWMLSFLVALVLWPAVAYGQSPEEAAKKEARAKAIRAKHTSENPAK